MHINTSIWSETHGQVSAVMIGDAWDWITGSDSGEGNWCICGSGAGCSNGGGSEGKCNGNDFCRSNNLLLLNEGGEWLTNSDVGQHEIVIGKQHSRFARASLFCNHEADELAWKWLRFAAFNNKWDLTAKIEALSEFSVVELS